MAPRSKHNGRKHTRKAAAKHSKKHTPKPKTQKKGNWLSWIPFLGRRRSMNGGAALAPESVDASSTLLSADMHGKPAGVDEAHVAPIHATSGGAQRHRERDSRQRKQRSERKQRDSRQRKQRSERKQRNSRQRKQRGGMAPLDKAYTMLLSAAESARAGLSPEWPSSN